MSRIKLWDRYFTPFISQEDIAKRVAEMGTKLSMDYTGKRPVFVAVLNGSLHFASDLTRHFEEKCEISFVKYTSYQGMQSTGKLQQVLGLQESVFGRHVILLEDIVDSGLTLAGIFESIAALDPLSIRTATLLYKPKAMRYSVKPDYVGFEIGNEFVVGYGMDYNGLGRNMPGLYQALPL
ncbi:MAG: hypoxanthine phosphoribosyltransferase [Bacteroidetes bacterium]|nr:MAG: hypoxanthine phosphoribosyltransferase [Bacteroidota bacterium]